MAATLRAPSERAQARALDIVCFADMEWDYLLWTNRQQVMSRLPALSDSVRVLYIAPPRFLGSRLARRDVLRRARFEGSRREGRWTRRVGERTWVLQPLLPISNGQARRLIPATLDRFLAATTRRALARLGFERPCLWTYTPLVLPLLDAVPRRLLVYDVVDDYAALPHYQRLLGARRAAEADAALTVRADVTFVVSRELYERRSPLSDSCVLVGNAADVELFATARQGLPIPSELVSIPSPRISFHGALTAEKLDYELLRALALRRPEWSFVLIGPDLDGSAARELGQLANVHRLGPRPEHSLPAYLAHASACLIPYRAGASASPLKAYECLAAGVSIVASPLPAYRELMGDVSLARSPAEAEDALERVFAGGGSTLALAEVAPYSWEAKAEQQLETVLARIAEGS